MIENINKFTQTRDVNKLRIEVHKLISVICYLDKNDEIVHLCKYILHQPKENPEMKILDYYTNEIIKYDFRILF